MVFGVEVTPRLMSVGGSALLALLVVQVAVGRRWIRLGRRHVRWHRRIAWALLAGGLAHGFLGLVLAEVVRVG